MSARNDFRRTWTMTGFFVAIWLGAGGGVSGQVTTRQDDVGQRLLEWHATGTAAGLNALMYENRDGGHSPLDIKAWPQLRAYQPTAEEKARKLDIGPAGQVRPFPLFGNCSMAASADKGGSLPRIYLAQQRGFEFLMGQYFGNNLFFYPEHEDYDRGWNGRGGWGDLYPANVPYLVISQGSSYTDQPFLSAFLSAAASLPPQTQALLIKSRLLIPTLQSVFRRSNRMVVQDGDYFTGAAHPPVFDGGQINEAKMAQLAHEMTPAMVPPAALVEVIQEEVVSAGKDFFELDEIKSEALGTTPAAVARVVRGAQRDRMIVLSARKSADLLRRPLEYRWVLLQGDAARVKIEPAHGGQEATITIAWHPELRAASGIPSHRVDLALFVGNGSSWSSPAFVTFYMLPNEARFYDGQGRLEEICYQAGNPDLGLPEAGDLRWLSLGRRLREEPEALGTVLMGRFLSSDHAKVIQGLADDLAPAQEAWRKFAANGDAAAAEAAKGQLQEKVRQRMLAQGGAGVVSPFEAVSQAIDGMASLAELYPSLQQSIEILVTRSSKPSARNSFANARKLLTDYWVLQVDRDGKFALAAPVEKLTQGDKYLLRQFHLALLSEAIFPEFLERVSGPAYVDPRLTTPKAWRDVYRYDNHGVCLGWTRLAGGKAYEFDLEGWLKPEGGHGKSVSVKYVRDEATGTLVFVPR